MAAGATKNIEAQNMFRLGKKVVALALGLSVVCFQAAEGRGQVQEGGDSLLGRIAGQVINGHTGTEVVSAQIVVEGMEIGGLSSVGGRYLIRALTPGTYALRVQHLGHAPKVVTGIVVTSGLTTQVDISLDPQAVAIEGIEVTATAERGNTAALMNQRQIAPAALDAIGREEMSRTPDGDAAEALKRVPGLTVVDGKYAYIRGLGERYSSTSLNGAPLASPVPDRRVIPLDMFPTDLLESVVTSKGYTPDQPGDHAGGHVELRTRSYPLEREFKVNISSGYNSATTLQDGLRYAGGGLDFLGFDDGTRALPSLIPTDRQVRFGSNFTRADLAGIGQAFQGDWGPTAQTARPPLSASVSLGDESEVFGRRLGYVASVNWSDSPSTRSDYVERQFVGSNLESFVAEFDYQGQLSTRNVTLGGLLNGSMELATGHELRANLVYSHLSEDQAREFRGFNLDSNTDQLNTRIQFIEQSMFNGQLEGTHLLPWAGESLLDWRAGYTLANRYEPNTREVLYRLAPDGRFLFDNFIQSGSVFHQDLEDAGASGAIDLEVPFTVSGLPSAFKMGGSLQVKDRDVYTRRFRFLPVPGGRINNDIRALSPNQLLAPGHIGTDGFEIAESTFRADNYDGADDRAAAYAMLDMSLGERLRVSAGARFERTKQDVVPFDLAQTAQTPLESADFQSDDILPALNLTFELSPRMNLRGGASRTLARAELRELAPFGFADYAGGANVVGNPNLQLTTIDNLDARWEWFFRPGAVVSVSAFYKGFTNPIEVSILPSTELLKTWVNAPEANNVGLEVEFRSDLEIVAESLENVLLSTNLTLVDSDVTTGDRVLVYLPGAGTTELGIRGENRALQGQSDYVVNGSLTWETRWDGTASVLFNRFGRRIDAVGGLGLPAEFEEARSQLDLVIAHPLGERTGLKFSATRLLGNVVTFKQFGEVLREYDLGRNVSLSFSWET